MPKQLSKVLLPMFAMLVFFIGAPATAQAQDTWMPDFRPGQTVYVDPSLDTSLSGLDRDLAALEKQHGMKVFVIFTRQGTEQNPPGTKFAPWKLDDLIIEWSKSGQFPANDALVILVVKARSNPNMHSVAGNAGTRLRTEYGLTKDHFSSSSGPVLRHYKAYLPNDPSGYFKQAVNYVNDDIDSAIFMAKLPARIGLGLLILSILGFFIFMIIRFRREAAKLKALLEQWRSRVQNAGQRYGELEDGYLGFLKRQAGWEKTFEGITKTRFQQAMAGYAELTLGKLALSATFDKAEALYNKAAWFTFLSVSGLRKGQALLTTEDIKVTGDELSTDEATLFGSTVKEETHKPDALMAKMEREFATVRDSLKEIKGAFDGVDENKGDIDGLMAEMEELKTAVTDAGLTFDPYTDRLAQIDTDQDAFEAILTSNPLEAYKQSEVVEDRARKLKADLERAIELKKSLADAEASITRADQRISSVRGQNIGYAYPLDGSEAALDGASALTFALKEKNGNPDPVVAKARENLKAALDAVLAGQLDRCAKMKAAAVEKANEAYDLVQTVLDAKAFVEKQVPLARTNLGTLKGEVPAATEAVASLRADFLKKNFKGEPEKLEGANGVIDATDGELAKIKKAYDEQRYVAARGLTANLGGDIQGSRDNLVEIHARLRKLRELRTHSRETVGRCESQVEALSTKLEQFDFTTAEATDDSYAKLTPRVVKARADVDKDITDWPAAAETADELEAGLTAVDAAIDQAKADYDRAVAQKSSLASAISSAADEVDHRDVRQTARNKLATAREVLATVKAELKHAKNDWAALARKAESGKGDATSAESTAQADKRAASSARSAISSAESAISSADRSYGEGVRADLSSARSKLRSANSSMSSDNYEDAKRHADSAKSAADSAASSARSKARRRREEREAEERRRREAAAAAARRASQSSSYGGGGFGGGGFGGGGHSGGGGFGGGGHSGGGGDF